MLGSVPEDRKCVQQCQDQFLTNKKTCFQGSVPAGWSHDYQVLQITTCDIGSS